MSLSVFGIIDKNRKTEYHIVAAKNGGIIIPFLFLCFH
jgi:hypothetical protein